MNASFTFDIGNGLRVGLSDDREWQVCAKSGCFSLLSTSDFYRVVILLERPYVEVQSLLAVQGDEAAHIRFPMWRVVGAGLAIQSEEWASLALNWLPQLPLEEQVNLEDLLLAVQGSRWASQKTRQLADRYAKQMRRLREDGGARS